MSYRFSCAALVTAVLAVGAFSHAANATSVSISNQDDVTLPSIASISNPAPSLQSGSVLIETGSVANQYRSPFEDFSSHVIAPGYENVAYTTIGSFGSGSATYDLHHPMTTLTFLWGSPDSYNTLKFYDGNTLVGTFTGSDLNIQTYGHDLVTFVAAGGTFDSITLSSSQAAFEFVDPSATPLPAALPLFAGGLGMIGWLARRRKQKNAAALAAA